MEFNEFQQIKRKFFSYRNGVTAEVLRKGGSPFQIIFGLTLPQLSAIASETGHNKELAEKLWSNNSTRCSMLLAPMVMPKDNFSYEECLTWCNAVPSFEIADVLCHKLISKQKYIRRLIPVLLEGNIYERYIGMRLILQELRKEEYRSEMIKEIRERKILKSDEFRLLKQQIIDELENE